MNKLYKQISEKISNAQKIAIIAHRNPDGDTIGSVAAIKESILINYKNKSQIDIISIDWVPEYLKYLDKIWETKKDFWDTKYDLYIFLDNATPKMTWFLYEDNLELVNTINIDHHISNTNFWEINLVWVDKPSTTSVLYDYFISEGLEINNYIATALLTWIYTDTWSLIFDNTTPETFEEVAHLMEKWWDIQKVADNIFLNSSTNFIWLLGLTLDRLKIVDNYWFSYLTKEDIISSGCDYEELVWIVWRLNSLNWVDYICFIYEKWENMVKWSLRTNRDNIDLTQIAKVHWWWWHRKASAFTYSGKIEINSDGVHIRTEDNKLIKFA